MAAFEVIADFGSAFGECPHQDQSIFAFGQPGPVLGRSVGPLGPISALACQLL